MQHEGLDLSLQHLHAGLGHDGAGIRHCRVAEDVVDEAMVALVAGRRNMLDREPIVLV